MPFRKLVAGYEDFHDAYFRSGNPVYEQLSSMGQKPEVLVIGCSDSRIDPAILTNSQPGDIFVIRNVAAIVPPCESDSRHHGTSAAIEFAVRQLQVKHIIVLAHSQCGGIAALLSGSADNGEETSFIHNWLATLEPARDRIEREFADEPQEIRTRAMEQAGLLVSLDNLMTFPWVAEAVESGALSLHGWYFDIRSGELQSYDGDSKTFRDVLGADALPVEELEKGCCRRGCQSEQL
ncbi:MAG: carbonic anhydrase [Alphaproteobacteria bacterium]|nr:carbonic anhydrase [Alphaproteobacteria bacterium]